MRRNFIAGLAILVPIVATFWVLKWLFELIDGILAPAFEPVFSIPGFGFITIVILIHLANLLVTNILGRIFIQFGQSLVEKVPIASKYITFSNRL